MKRLPTSYIIGYDDTDYVDVIPAADCVRSRKGELYVHPVVGPTGKYWSAEAIIAVDDKMLQLEYRDTPHNERNGMEIGTLRLFYDLPGSPLTAATWTDEDGKVKNVNSNGSLPLKASLQPIVDQGVPRLREVVPRKGQAAFRNSVLIAYGFTCAISHCTAAEALEAAHISPFAQSKNQNPRNGILLRRDLHALFDAELLGLSPDGTVCFHRKIDDSTYKEMATWRRPDNASLRPDNKALKQRWDVFVSKTPPVMK